MVKGNDLTVVALASIYDADSGAYIAFNLGVCTGVTMRLVRSFNRIEAKNISVDGNEVSATFAGSKLTTGTYGVEILFSKDGQDGRIFENDLFAIVTDSGDASIDTAAGGGNGQGYNITVDIKSRTLRIGQVSGITDYNLLENRPSIGGVTLEGNKRPSDLGMYSKEEAQEKFETKESAAEADKRVQGMLDGKVDKEPGKGLSANDLTDERAGKVDMLAKDGRANEYLNGAGTYSRPVRQGYGMSVADDNTVSVDPQVIARQSDVANVAADLAAQKAKEQGDNRVVAEAIVSLAARLDALEGSRGRLGNATAGTVDVRGLTRCRYPLVMLAHGVPAEANVPVNLPEGLPWDGVPAFAGQQYVNLDAAAGGLYYAAGVDSVADWKQA